MWLSTHLVLEPGSSPVARTSSLSCRFSSGSHPHRVSPPLSVHESFASAFPESQRIPEESTSWWFYHLPCSADPLVLLIESLWLVLFPHESQVYHPVSQSPRWNASTLHPQWSCSELHLRPPPHQASLLFVRASACPPGSNSLIWTPRPDLCWQRWAWWRAAPQPPLCSRWRWAPALWILHLKETSPSGPPLCSLRSKMIVVSNQGWFDDNFNIISGEVLIIQRFKKYMRYGRNISKDSEFMVVGKEMCLQDLQLQVRNSVNS